MATKNLLTLHEAIVLALINKENRSATFTQIAAFIEKRKLYTQRKGNIPLETQVMLRSTKAKGAYAHLFDQIDLNRIQLKKQLTNRIATGEMMITNSHLITVNSQLIAYQFVRL